MRAEEEPAGSKGGDQPGDRGVGAARLAAGLLAAPGVLVAAAGAFALAVRGRLPDPIAIHWQAGGRANGYASLWGLVGVMAAIGTLMWGMGVAGALAGRGLGARFHFERAAMAWCCGVTTFFTGIFVLALSANLDTPDAAASRLTAWMIIPVIVLACAAGVAGWLMAGHAPPIVTTPVATGAGDGARASQVAIELAPGEQRVWSSHLASPVLLATSSAIGAFGLAVLVFLNSLIGALLIAAALGISPLSSITAVVDPTGLQVRFGMLGWPRKKLPLDSIASCSAGEVNPLEWGGWGYRIMPSRSAVVLRRGPGIMVTRSDGRSFAVTIDDAETGAALLEAYRRRTA